MLLPFPDTYVHISIAALIIMAASLAGKLFTWGLLARFAATRMRLLVATAAGVFTIAIYNLAHEALHESGLSYSVAGAFVVGMVLLEGMTRLLPKNTHHHHGPHPEHHHSGIDARRMLLGDAVHNVHDGLTLVPAFLLSLPIGYGTALGILLHELVQEVSEFFVLREAGYSVRKALTWNFIVSTTILIGVGIAGALATTDGMERLLIAFSAGAFTYILFRDLAPSIVAHARQERRPLTYLLAFCVGGAAMFGVTTLVPHEHHEEDYPLPSDMGLATAPHPSQQA